MSHATIYPMPMPTVPTLPQPAQRPAIVRSVPRRILAANLRVDDTRSAASILNRGERPLELSLLMTGGMTGVVSVRNRDRQQQLVRVLMLRRRISVAVDCAREAAVTLEPQHDGTIVAVEVPAFTAVDIRFVVARAEEILAGEDATAQAAALVLKAARAG